MKGELRIRRGQASDLEAVIALGRSIEEVPHWSEDVYGSLLGQDEGTRAVRRYLVVAECAEELVGFAVGKVVGTGIDAVAELESVAVAKEARHRGVGRALCEEVIAWGRSEGAINVELEVRSANAPALALYRGMGFVEVGVRKGYYHSPPDDAVLMNFCSRRE